MFCNYGNSQAPFKLRILYECAPIAYLFECAGAKVCDEKGDRLLERKVGLDIRCGICLGSKDEVDRYIHHMADEARQE